MPQVNLIAAVGRRGQLGLGGKIPWRDMDDLRWFRETTQGGVIIIGKRTFDNIPPTIFLGRRLWIVTRENCNCHDPEEVIALAAGMLDEAIDKTPGRDAIWISGGEFVYRLWMPYVRRAFITLVDYDGEADTYMPPLWRAML